MAADGCDGVELLGKPGAPVASFQADVTDSKGPGVRFPAKRDPVKVDENVDGEVWQQKEGGGSSYLGPTASPTSPGGIRSLPRRHVSMA